MYSKIEKGLILLDLNEIFSLKPSKFEIFDSIESSDKKKSAEN